MTEASRISEDQMKARKSHKKDKVEKSGKEIPANAKDMLG